MGHPVSTVPVTEENAEMRSTESESPRSHRWSILTALLVLAALSIVVSAGSPL